MKKFMLITMFTLASAWFTNEAVAQGSPYFTVSPEDLPPGGVSPPADWPSAAAWPPMPSLHVELPSVVAQPPTVPRTYAESTFAGVLLSGRGEGLVAGNINFTITHGQVSFQSTLFQSYVTGTSLEPVLVVQRKVIPLSFGTGTAGSFRIEEFLGPIPGLSASPPPCGFTGIDPGFGMPVYADGTRFTGLFKASPGLDNLLRTKGGTLYLQIHGTVIGLQDPLFSAPLVEVSAPSTIQFSATLSGENEVPRNTSPYHSTASFALNGNCLGVSFALDLGFGWTSGGIYGPAGHHSSSTNLLSDFGNFFGVFIPSGQPGYNGQIVFSGVIGLTDEQVDQLKRGKLYVNFLSAQYPNGEIRGQIMPGK